MSLPAPIPFEEAQARLLDAAHPLPTETVPVAQAAGRYLTEDLAALRTQPAADLSAMDGYAVRADDLAGPWQVVGESAAGHPFAGQLEAGQAVRISTGALMPAAGGAVLLQESAMRTGDYLSLAEGGAPTPRHIRRKGFDFAAGDSILDRGTRIGPAQLALLLSAGHTDVPAVRRPRVTVLDSGDELASDPSSCAPHQIPASNGAMLAALAAPYASKVDRIGPVADRMEALQAALGQAEDCDVLVTSGGASVGDHDLLRPALEQWGAQIAFWRVAMKPGKPLLIARRDAQWIVGLPGNPVSSYVTAHLFLLPLLRKLAGAPDPRPVRVDARAGASFGATGARAEFVRAILVSGQASPVMEQDSSALGVLARANALIYRPAKADPLAVGDAITAYPLENGGNA